MPAMIPTPEILMPGFAARIDGFDIRAAGPAELDELRALMRDYPALVLGGQEISDADHIAFARAFGPIEGKPTLQDFYKSDAPTEVLEVSNVDANRNILPPSDRRRLVDLGNRMWHSDSSFRRTPAHLSMLYGIKVAKRGGETQIADLRAAYDGLSPDWKALVEGLVAEHNVMQGRMLLGFEWSEEERAAMQPDAWHPLVRTLPETGRRTLYLSAHASHILDMPIPEGRVLLYELMDIATTQGNVYTHQWREKDLLIWDNRCTVHRARRYDIGAEARVFHRVSTSDARYAESVEGHIGATAAA